MKKLQLVVIFTTLIAATPNLGSAAEGAPGAALSDTGRGTEWWRIRSVEPTTTGTTPQPEKALSALPDERRSVRIVYPAPFEIRR